ncbi:MAG: metallophosphoesterase [Tidjanibacter sp.]|nr:metallophosphoesterase [Tidjanibacter sp.]
MLQMVSRKIGILGAIILFVGCDKVDFKGFFVPTGDIVNKRFEQSFDLHGGKPIAQIEAADSYLFYVCTDPHIGGTTNNLSSFVADLRSDPLASFGLVLGDCIDRLNCMPIYAEAIAPKDPEKDVPILSVLGNHDTYFSQWDKFREEVGPSVYWFEVTHPSGKDLFISLDSANGTLGSLQMEWLRGFLPQQRNTYRHCIIITHTNIFYTDNSQVTSGNYPYDETMALIELFAKNNILLCLQGHDHHREDLTFDGVRYTIVGTLRDEVSDPEYLCVRISSEGTEYEWREIGN